MEKNFFSINFAREVDYITNLVISVLNRQDDQILVTKGNKIHDSNEDNVNNSGFCVIMNRERLVTKETTILCSVFCI